MLVAIAWIPAFVGMMAFIGLRSIVIYHLIRDKFLNHVQKSSH
ncbi:hypothetical protein SAMN05216428_10522 [Nitrosospira sp. Nsp11]|nr:hypothetical protein SAMN05216428_10522 [Nitrosospira sp. Nsp11]